MLKGVKLCLFSLFCVCVGPVLCFVDPPDNVTVSCHNFENVVYWNYSDTGPQPEFLVTIQNYKIDENSTLTTTEKHLVITNYTEGVNVYRVNVKAQLDGSEDSQSIEVLFTYSTNFKFGTTCMVDFPDINISSSQHSIEFSFDHPYDFYGVDYEEEDLFEYAVTCNETECGILQCFSGELCTGNIHLPENLYSHCFIVHFEGYVSNIPLKTSVEVCSPIVRYSETDVMFIIGLVCAGVVLLLVMAGVIYKRLTRSKPQIAIISQILGIVPKNSGTSVIEPEQPTLSEVTSISHTPLLLSSEDVIFTPTTPSPVEATHMPIFSTTGEQLSDEQEHGDSEEDDDSGGFTSFSGYDCKKFPLEISPGDVVDAYRP